MRLDAARVFLCCTPLQSGVLGWTPCPSGAKAIMKQLSAATRSSSDDLPGQAAPPQITMVILGFGVKLLAVSELLVEIMTHIFDSELIMNS